MEYLMLPLKQFNWEKIMGFYPEKKKNHKRMHSSL